MLGGFWKQLLVVGVSVVSMMVAWIFASVFRDGWVAWSAAVKGAKGSYVASFGMPSYFTGLFNNEIITLPYWISSIVLLVVNEKKQKRLQRYYITITGSFFSPSSRS